MASLAELLRELKERSGLSYGVLAKRLHMSTSTLHRYCNGDAVPTEFAPVERLARLCKASPEELVEVHRRWILADAARGRKPQGEPEPAAPAPASAPAPALTPAPAPKGPERPTARKRRRTLVLAASVAAVVGIGSAALAVNGGGDDGGERRAAATTHPSKDTAPDAGPTKGEGGSGGGDKNGDEPGSKDKKGEGPSASPRAPSDEKKPRPGRSESDGKGPSSAGGSGDLGVPLAARTRPYVYESPCSQNFLVNRRPHQVPQPPAVEQDAPGWAADLGAVSAGEQLVEVTVQGMGRDTVVLQGMNVRVQSTSSPLAWNNFEMGVGCGGNVSTKSFGVDLDDGTPRLTPRAGQRDFPYKVSENDPEVFYVKAGTEAHDVRWYLEISWSSGRRHGVLRVDDQGKPFRTSGNEGRATYGWPLGGAKWEEMQGG